MTRKQSFFNQLQRHAPAWVMKGLLGFGKPLHKMSSCEILITMNIDAVSYAMSNIFGTKPVCISHFAYVVYDAIARGDQYADFLEYILEHRHRIVGYADGEILTTHRRTPSASGENHIRCLDIVWSHVKIGGYWRYDNHSRLQLEAEKQYVEAHDERYARIFIKHSPLMALSRLAAYCKSAELAAQLVQTYHDNAHQMSEHVKRLFQHGLTSAAQHSGDPTFIQIAETLNIS